MGRISTAINKTTKPSNTEPSNATLEQAAEWFATLRDGNACTNDQALWQQWLNAAEEHRIAWRYVEHISRGFVPLQQTPDPKQTVNKLHEANQRLRHRRQVLASIVALVGVGLLGRVGWQQKLLPDSVMAWAADYRTGVGEQQNITLVDGTRIWLNTASAVDTSYSPSTRRIALIDGEVFIDTATDASRSFIVATEHGQLRALGTRFNVHQHSNETLLAVYEGAVEIRTKITAQTIIINAGQQARFTENNISAVTAADIAREAWTRGVLVAYDIPLSEVVAELRRYGHGHIGLAEEVASLKVYGNFPINNTDQVLDMLTTVLPVEIKHTLPWWVSIEPR